MINMIENSKHYKSSDKTSKYGEYLYLIDTYIISELIHNISGLHYYEYIYKYIVKPLNLTEEMFVPIPSELLKNQKYEDSKKKNVNNQNNVNTTGGLSNNNLDKTKKYIKDKKTNVIDKKSIVMDKWPNMMKDYTTGALKNNEYKSTSFIGGKKFKKSSTISNFIDDINDDMNFYIMNAELLKFENINLKNTISNKKKFDSNQKVLSKKRSISVDVYYSKKKIKGNTINRIK